MVVVQKRKIRWVISLFLVMLYFSGLTAQAQYGGGSGEPNDPYLIYTAEQMNEIGLHEEDWDKHFILINDIDLSAYNGTQFNIIGRYFGWDHPDTKAFSGVFDGNGHTISNFSYTSTDRNYIGLFGYVDGEDAQIKDLGLIDANVDAGTGDRVGSLVGYMQGGTIINCYAEGGSVLGDWSVGGLLGKNEDGTITNCYVQGGSVSGWSGVGGLLGGNGDNGYSGTITNCYSTGTVSGNSSVGGLVGSSEYGGRIINCYTNCNVTGGDYVGGLAGGIGGEVYIPLVVPNIITNCYSIGGVSGRNLVGGLVGQNYDGTITNCYSSASVSGNDYVGGLVGDNFFGSIATSYSSGAVSGTSGVGGLVGLNAFWGSIATSYSTGTVSGNSKVGGLVGENVFVNLFGDESKGITTSYSIGTVTGNENVGGLVGSGWASDVTNCFWDMETSGQTSSAGGTGKTTAEMQTKSTFTDAGWDFVNEAVSGTEDIWRILEGQDYPRLWWEKYGGGTGEPNDPYLIYTAEQMNAIGLLEEDWDKHFKLMADIDLSGYTGTDFNIIGYYVSWNSPDNKPFTGIFDGNGHRISNFSYISTGTSYVGLFGYVDGAEIKDLGLIDPNIDAGTGDDVGSLVGCLRNGAITGCYAEGGSVSGNENVGGLVGSNYDTITNCYSTGTVTGNGDVGGLVGWNGRTIRNCSSTGSVSGNGEVGGLVGMNYRGGTITGCFWDIETSGQVTSDGGTGKTTAEMQMESTFTDAGWDFVGESENGTEDIWSICEGTNYPRLVWQIPAGDFVCPDGITIEDFVFFIEHWWDDNCDLSNDYCQGTDLDFSGTADEADLEILVENWLAVGELEN